VEHSALAAHESACMVRRGGAVAASGATAVRVAVSPAAAAYAAAAGMVGAPAPVLSASATVNFGACAHIERSAPTALGTPVAPGDSSSQSVNPLCSPAASASQSSSAASQLTDEQRARIADKKRAAMVKRTMANSDAMKAHRMKMEEAAKLNLQRTGLLKAPGAAAASGGIAAALAAGGKVRCTGLLKFC
jgi:hypothetical protein